MSNQPPPAPAAAPKRSKRGLILIVAALVLLLGGGGAAYWVYAGRASGSESAEAPPKQVPPGIVTFEPFVSNLAGDDPRYARMSLALLIAGKEHAAELAEDSIAMTRLRSEVLDLLALQDADALLTAEGKSALKKLIAERVPHVAHKVEVVDVLFSEFIVQ